MNMATASICGSAQSEIIHAVVELSLRFFPDRLRSIVLTGSFKALRPSLFDPFDHLTSRLNILEFAMPSKPHFELGTVTKATYKT